MGDLIVKSVASADFKSLKSKGDEAHKAMIEAVSEAGASAVAKGRADISSAGNFGSRWLTGLQYHVEDGSEKITLEVTEAVPYWTVFQHGKTIQGKPLLFFKPTVMPAGATTMPSVISKRSVTIPKKFHLIEIATAEAAKVPELFKEKMQQASKG